MKWILTFMLLWSLALPAAAGELLAPEVPEAGEDFMPENTASFSDGLWELIQKAVDAIRPEIREGARISVGVIAAAMIFSLCGILFEGTGSVYRLAGAAVIGALLLESSQGMIGLAAGTVRELGDYGKMLLPVMTAALAAQGGATGSAGLYLGTAFFSTFLGNLLSKVFVPMIYLFLALGIGAAAAGEELLKKLRDMVKNLISWTLKTILTVFTTYMSITGVVSGTTDAAALKAAKVTISSFVPVVGGILSDASEAVLVGAGVMKNAAGIYGIFAVLSLFLGPFLRIGAQYLSLKATALVCSLLDSGKTTALVEDFSTAMGLLLGITGAMCLLLLISTVCFLKGVG